MEAKSDQKILLDAYRRYVTIAKGKPLSAKQQRLKADELFRQAEMKLLFLNSPTTGIAEKDKLLRRSKLIYQQYAAFLNGNPGAVSKSLEKKMALLLEQMAIHESAHVARFRKSEAGGDRIDLEALLQNEPQVRELVSEPIAGVLTRALKDKRFTIVSKTDQKVYISKTGERYHRADCPYCKRVQLTESSFEKVKNAGYQPCRCMTRGTKRISAQMLSPEKTDEKKTFVSAFIDESVRETPWGRFDPKYAGKQASYSYIVCRGKLASEDEITKENTICKNVCLANEAQDTTYSAVEAISAVLMKLAFQCGFRGDVLIYTDNMGAKDRWYKNENNEYLASLFESVTVYQIPREQNKKADALGRTKNCCEVPTALVNQLYEMQQEYEKMKKEMHFVKRYFPVPLRNIPNLLRELSLLAGEGEQ